MKDRENVKVESRPTDSITILPLLTLGKWSEVQLILGDRLQRTDDPTDTRSVGVLIGHYYRHYTPKTQ
ncbi:hypothetical protein Zmor_027661 [Zophobas morio]|uniref:Uncharacterized protein n=1 Tax=Zophobas morio TaxID=2755281 RepID=A0AA38HTW1_9CUCU|nr:hypothetical protein Zmor_027661 [Zophobas morio]